MATPPCVRWTHRREALKGCVDSEENRSGRSGFGAGALPTTTGGLRGLLPALDRGLHIVPTALELPKDSFSGHLALEVLDRAFDPLVADGALQGLADNGLARTNGHCGRRGVR